MASGAAGAADGCTARRSSGTKNEARRAPDTGLPGCAAGTAEATSTADTGGSGVTTGTTGSSDAALAG
ncbi:hypothetical protein NIIDMKKI_03750 [Mycobacterium kansasii]|uniref:Uncharacterized protein n=1 Tax=Mycobacterium kansasii TaxID=1768 RepID=A0A653F7Q9_MYCKA|nr:hypothetical protein MKSMC1_61450 [Mycobacterium kansasii]BCI85169.1 hypothetical protein NIIDMKKI_03750 [Mycobacterium kansasii]VTP05022.1 hypothetical protein BIN_B_04863 [Mycobacterium kansasii]